MLQAPSQAPIGQGELGLYTDKYYSMISKFVQFIYS